MFRSKTKRSGAGGAGGAGGATRKRKEIDADSDDETAAAVPTLGTIGVAASADELSVRRRRAGDGNNDDDVDGDAPEQQTRAAAAAVTTSGTSNTDAVDAGGGGSNNEEEEDALLARMRSRNAKRGKPPSTMTFRSRTATHGGSQTKSTAAGSSSHAQRSAVGGSLSFDDDIAQAAASKRSGSSSRQGKIRPNLLASSTSDARTSDDSGDGSAQRGSSAYSFEMLEALRREQNVLLHAAPGSDEPAAPASSTAPEQDAATGVTDDVTMDELDGATIVVDEPNDSGGAAAVTASADDAEDDDGDDFIPLNAQALQNRKKRNRVTFGVHADALPRLAKTTQVREPTDDSDDDAVDAERESRQWEEELMRRGGFHPVPTAARAADSNPSKRSTYPTRKGVPTASLSDVLAKLQRSIDAASFETDRAERERTRLVAEAQLLRESVAVQRSELRVASNEFEYFQVVEDFVKGLSYCLRAKVREIDALERDVLAQRIASVRSSCDADATRAQDIVNALVAVDAITPSDDTPGLRIFHTRADSVLPTLGDHSVDAKVAATLRSRFVDREHKPEHSSHRSLDVFADAIDDMTSLERVCNRFADWRRKFPHVYASCYCDVALEQLLTPYVRAELLDWDPLSVAHVPSVSAGSKAWSFDGFDWFRVLQSYTATSSEQQSTGSDGGGGNSTAADTAAADTSDPAVAQIRDVVLVKARDAVAAYFDPFASLHTRSVCILLEEVGRRDGYTVACTSALRSLTEQVTRQFVTAAKCVPLIALRDASPLVLAQSGVATIRDFAIYELTRFNTLLDNLLTFFVALPRDAASNSSQSVGFRGIMQLLHQLLAFLSHSTRVEKTLLVPQAAQTAAQLTTSPYLQQLLASSAQEQELKRVLALLAPFCSSSSSS